MKQTLALIASCLLISLEVALPRAQSQRAPAPTTPPPGQVAGRVVRPDGLPQPDAQVVLAERTRAGALRQLPWRGRTAFDGRYEIAGVPPGRYLVLVRAIGADVAAAGRPEATLFPGVPTSEPGTLVEVLSGISSEGIDVWLVPSPRRFTVSGRVFGPGDNSFDSLVIETGRPGGRATDVWTVEDPGGVFGIDPVPPGALVLRARATIGNRVLTGLATTTVAATPVEDVRITVHDPIEVSGRVQAEGAPAIPGGLSVVVTPQVLAPSVLYPSEEAAVDTAGKFRARSEAGVHTVRVQGLPTGWVVRRVTGAIPLDRDAAFAVSNGASAATLDVVIGPSAR